MPDDVSRALAAIDRHYEEHRRQKQSAPPRLDPAQELQAIHTALSHALNALESDATLEQRREAFSEIQDLYEPGRLLNVILRESYEDGELDGADDARQSA